MFIHFFDMTEANKEDMEGVPPVVPENKPKLILVHRMTQLGTPANKLGAIVFEHTLQLG